MHPILTPDLTTPEKRQQSLQPTEKAAKTNIKSECMCSVETTLEEQAKSLGTETSQLIKRLVTPRPMNIEERNELLDILFDKTSNENLVAQTIFRCKSLMESLRACIVADINDMAKKITSMTCQPGPSVLRWMAGDDILQHKDLMFQAVLELKTVFPIAFEVLMTLCCPPYVEKRNALPTMAMIYGMAMHTRNKDMSAIQRISTCVVTRYNPGGELLQIFNKFALTFANSCTLSRLIHKLDVLDRDEAMATADAKAGNDVGGTLSGEQKQDGGDNSNHPVSAEPAKNPPEFSFLSEAAESCIKEMFKDRLTRNREKERSREIRQLQKAEKAEKKKRRATKVGNCPGKDVLSKTHLKKRRTSPHCNIALSGRKRRQVILQIRRAAEENDQIEAPQNPGQTGLVGRVIDTSNRSGEHSVTEYTIVKNTDEDSSSEVGENSMIDYAEVKNTDVDYSSEDGENSMIDYAEVKNTDVDYSSEDGGNSMIDYAEVKNTDVDYSSEDGENSVTDYKIVKNTEVEMEDEANEQPLCYIPDFHIPDFPVK